jgi:hypothetical protein
MNELLIDFIREKRIDSFQKVSFLLFLHQHASQEGVSREFARQLNFAADPLLEEVVQDLKASGVLEQQGEHYRLPNQPEVFHGMQHLAQAYEDPMTRQALLGRLYRRHAA